MRRGWYDVDDTKGADANLLLIGRVPVETGKRSHALDPLRTTRVLAAPRQRSPNGKLRTSNQQIFRALPRRQRASFLSPFGRARPLDGQPQSASPRTLKKHSGSHPASTLCNRGEPPSGDTSVTLKRHIGVTRSAVRRQSEVANGGSALRRASERERTGGPVSASRADGGSGLGEHRAERHPRSADIFWQFRRPRQNDGHKNGLCEPRPR